MTPPNRLEGAEVDALLFGVPTLAGAREEGVTETERQLRRERWPKCAKCERAVDHVWSFDHAQAFRSFLRHPDKVLAEVQRLRHLGDRYRVDVCDACLMELDSRNTTAT